VSTTPSTRSSTPAADELEDRLEFVVDPDAAPGDVVPAVATVLIGIARRRKEREAVELEARTTEGQE
jgi:hypothetical protein